MDTNRLFPTELDYYCLFAFEISILLYNIIQIFKSVNMKESMNYIYIR